MPAGPYGSLVAADAMNAPYPMTGAPVTIVDFPPDGVRQASANMMGGPNMLPTSASMIVPASEYPDYVDAQVYCEGDPYPHRTLFDPSPSGGWGWQVLPEGLIYHSYQAGVRESRTSLVWFGESDGRNLWDATLGGRAGLVRFGNYDALRPQGWQLDIEGAALVRLNLEADSDLDSADFRFGVPLTYGVGDWQFKLAYYHLSAHMGDEFAIRNPGSLTTRINYVRDAMVLGASYYVVPAMRVYSEVAYATNNDGGAEPWELQFGTELSRPGPTGPRGTPFLAINTHLRQEHDFGGDFASQVGWLWRGLEGQTMRAGVHYFNGKSSQYQTFDESEQQIGGGLWYDF